MSTGEISFPFRLTATGEVATVERGSDASVREAIAVLLLTRPGERPLSPEYGTPDPAYAGLSAGGIQLGLDTYGPEGILVEALELTPRTDTESEAVVRWSRVEGEAS
ncbi:baseplate wedge protein [Arthrobacter phage Prairie]|uniref:Baseplate wedge protein n=2 Tax=Lilmacvirus TaxID=3425005 RepID=A0AAE9BRP7_9CAUD|nr:baseplate wedge protein [Arthrobacter phage Prairie]UAW09389.1 baseplate wedge protein [Arthrobacter phage Klevey]